MHENELATFATRKTVYIKVVYYLFNPENEDDWPKGQWFIRALGYDNDNLEHVKMLVSQIIFDARLAVFIEETKWGNRYEQWFAIIGPNGRTIGGIRAIWQRDVGTGIIRLLTLMPPKSRRS